MLGNYSSTLWGCFLGNYGSGIKRQAVFAGGEYKFIMDVDLEGCDLVAAGPRPRQVHDFRASACPGEVDPVRRQGHAPTPESTALPGHIGSLGEPGSLSEPI
jgi:hypothetical protein